MRTAAVVAFLIFLIGRPGSAETPRVGEFELDTTVDRLLDGPSLESFARLIPAATPVEWSVYVPGSYDPERPAGLLVYISPRDSGRIPDEWKPVMERRNLIWIGAHRSGNQRSTTLRIAYAILAPIVLQKTYRIDAGRVYLSGFSGGGRVSSMVAADYAHIFKGAIYNCGANLWEGERPGRYEEMRSNRFVFVTGTGDFNLRDTQKVFNGYKKAGMPNIKLMVIPHMSHRNPPARQYEEAIEFLDSREED